MNEIIDTPKVDKRIESFLKQNTNLTLATSAGNIPYCANCFFAYAEAINAVVFKSKRDTNHIKQALQNRSVAGSIVPDKLDPSKIQGIQFQGILLEPQNELLDLIKKVYYVKYPFALAFAGELWVIELISIKMTDNALGFGKKIEWKK